MTMSRGGALLGSFLFLVLAPGVVAGYLPWAISRWHMEPPFLGLPALRIVGALLIVAGLPVLLESFTRFAMEGFGTPAPVAPPEHLVVRGFYRHVRNPMYVAVESMVLGQAFVFASRPLLVYAAVLWLAFHLFVVAYEEPDLVRRFGSAYETYRRAVPRWLPRARPWSVD
jgi:protein-S-isoprenylcysteine O-methyltransferase Ste14